MNRFEGFVWTALFLYVCLLVLAYFCTGSN
nr:MAG TPA: protein of unknown function (DUF5359) [Caudoviricetes sp.]